MNFAENIDIFGTVQRFSMLLGEKHGFYKWGLHVGGVTIYTLRARAGVQVVCDLLNMIYIYIYID